MRDFDIVDLPFITVIVPVRNEEHYLARCLESLLQGGYSLSRMEILVADGQSSDHTLEILGYYVRQHPQVKKISNPGRTQAWAVNQATCDAHPESEFFIRVDAHSFYPDGFLENCVRTALRTKADLVVYVNEPVAEECFQEAVAFAFSHFLGVGDSRYRLGGFSGFVDHGQHGCFRREIFIKSGGYDTDLASNEDAELSERIIKSGGTIYLDDNLRMKYSPRKTIAALARQYYHYGRGRWQNLRKHRRLPKWRQAAPPLYLGLEAGCLAGAFWLPQLLLVPVFYLLILTGFAMVVACTKKKTCLLWLPVVIAVMHHSWAAGLWREWVLGRCSKIGKNIMQA